MIRLSIALVSISLFLAVHSAQASNKNVLLLIGDDHGTESAAPTPNLDRLAAPGARFANGVRALSIFPPEPVGHPHGFVQPHQRPIRPRPREQQSGHATVRA